MKILLDRYPGTRILILNVKKYNKSDLVEDIAFCLESFKSNKPRIIVALDSDVDITDYFLASWVTLNNIDPLRDISLLTYNNDSLLLLDATSKESALNNFSRPWPNVIVMDDATISNIDRKWEKIIPYRFLESPSLRFKKMVKNSGAVANPGYFTTH